MYFYGIVLKIVQQTICLYFHKSFCRMEAVTKIKTGGPVLTNLDAKRRIARRVDPPTLGISESNASFTVKVCLTPGALYIH